MARDRQRAKQRKQRRAAIDGGRTREPVPADLPAGDDPVDPISSPDPIAHASATADEARLAIAGGELPEDAADLPGEDAADLPGRDSSDGLDSTDELGSEVGGPPDRQGASGPRAGAELSKDGNRFFNFLGACWAELQRVQWPDRKAVFQATGVVLGFVLIAGGYLGLIDVIAQKLVNAII